MSMGVVAAAAAAAERACQEEEQEMTPYTDQDLVNGWEFKIVRAYTAAFRKPERLRAVLEEEMKGGWVLVEKSDDSRIRLKRPASAKSMEKDFADGYDPYHTTVGMQDTQRAIFLLVAAGAAVMFLMVLIFIRSL